MTEDAALKGRSTLLRNLCCLTPTFHKRGSTCYLYYSMHDTVGCWQKWKSRAWNAKTRSGHVEKIKSGCVQYPLVHLILKRTLTTQSGLLIQLALWGLEHHCHADRHIMVLWCNSKISCDVSRPSCCKRAGRQQHSYKTKRPLLDGTELFTRKFLQMRYVMWWN